MSAGLGWRVTVDGVAYEGRDPGTAANAVFSVLRKIEYLTPAQTVSLPGDEALIRVQRVVNVTHRKMRRLDTDAIMEGEE